MSKLDLETVGEKLPLLEGIRTARAIRRLSTKPVPKELIRKVCEAGTFAPSGGNRQPWIFVAVTEPERRAWIGERYRRAFRAYIAPAQEAARAHLDRRTLLSRLSSLYRTRVRSSGDRSRFSRSQAAKHEGRTPSRGSSPPGARASGRRGLDASRTPSRAGPVSLHPEHTACLQGSGPRRIADDRSSR